MKTMGKIKTSNRNESKSSILGSGTSEHSFLERYPDAKAYLVYMNDGIRVCAQACSCCWDKKVPEDYEAQVDYVGRRCQTGHTSVLEHSSFIVLLETTIDEQTLDFLAACRYLEVIHRPYRNREYFLIGGSYRGYEELYRLLHNPTDNIPGRAIAEVLYQYLDKRIFYSLVQDDILNGESFIGVEPDPASMFMENLSKQDTVFENDKVSLISFDKIERIKNNLNVLIGNDIFSTDEIKRVAHLTILFKNMSRTATHQLVRHRNGITQESQRYVDYSDADFTDPCEYKPDRYVATDCYAIDFCGNKYELQSKELGNELSKIYGQLLDQGMLKEDARGFLPSNIQCKKLYMTFTYKSFDKFIELRTHSAAQAEIRSFAQACKELVESAVQCDRTTATKENVDEIISDKEEIFQNILKNDESFKEENNNGQND